jgi:hypothetical protein
MLDNLPDWDSRTLSEFLRFAEYNVRASALHMPDVFAVFQKFETRCPKSSRQVRWMALAAGNQSTDGEQAIPLPSETSAIAASCAK